MYNKQKSKRIKTNKLRFVVLYYFNIKYINFNTKIINYLNKTETKSTLDLYSY